MYKEYDLNNFKEMSDNMLKPMWDKQMDELLLCHHPIFLDDCVTINTFYASIGECHIEEVESMIYPPKGCIWGCVSLSGEYKLPLDAYFHIIGSNEKEILNSCTGENCHHCPNLNPIPVLMIKRS